MPILDAVVALVREWVVKAEHDLLNATHTLKLGVLCPTDTVCFHAQQCIEKYIKAFLVHRAIPFPKTHDIQVLRGLVPARFRPKLHSKDQDQLTEYATVMRYPGNGPELSLSEARRAVAIARRIRREVRKHLPRAAR